MSSLQITTGKNEETTTGFSYHFSRNRIDYSIYLREDCVDVWRCNNQRCSETNDCFWDGVNNKGLPMAKFLRSTLEMIKAEIDNKNPLFVSI